MNMMMVVPSVGCWVSDAGCRCEVKDARENRQRAEPTRTRIDGINYRTAVLCRNATRRGVAPWRHFLKSCNTSRHRRRSANNTLEGLAFRSRLCGGTGISLGSILLPPIRCAFLFCLTAERTSGEELFELRLWAASRRNSTRPPCAVHRRADTVPAALLPSNLFLSPYSSPPR